LQFLKAGDMAKLRHPSRNPVVPPVFVSAEVVEAEFVGGGNSEAIDV
jgi:hypothetical protein